MLNYEFTLSHLMVLVDRHQHFHLHFHRPNKFLKMMRLRILVVRSDEGIGVVLMVGFGLVIGFLIARQADFGFQIQNLLVKLWSASNLTFIINITLF